MPQAKAWGRSKRQTFNVSGCYISMCSVKEVWPTVDKTPAWRPLLSGSRSPGNDNKVSPERLRVWSEPGDEERMATSGDVPSMLWELQPQSPTQGSITCEESPPLSRCPERALRPEDNCPVHTYWTLPLGFSPPEVVKTVLIKQELKGKSSARKERGGTNQPCL